MVHIDSCWIVNLNGFFFGGVFSVDSSSGTLIVRGTLSGSEAPHPTKSTVRINAAAILILLCHWFADHILGCLEPKLDRSTVPRNVRKLGNNNIVLILRTN